MGGRVGAEKRRKAIERKRRNTFLSLLGGDYMYDVHMFLDFPPLSRKLSKSINRLSAKWGIS